jgi:hypothetical protein
MMEEKRNEILRFIISRFDHYFNLANIKASLLLTINGVLIGVAFSTYLNLFNKAIRPGLKTCVQIGFSMSVILVLISAYFALKVIFAFLKSGKRSLDYHSLVFFGSIQEIEREIFVKKFQETSLDEINKDLIEQAHVLSSGLYKKYKHLNIAVVLTGLGFLFSVLTGIVIYWS